MKRRKFIKTIVDTYHKESGLFDHSQMLVLEDKQVAQQPNCFAMIEVEIDDNVYSGYGFSKVCYPDKWDRKKGLSMSRDRAVVDLAETLWNNAHSPTTFAVMLDLV